MYTSLFIILHLLMFETAWRAGCLVDSLTVVAFIACVLEARKIVKMRMVIDNIVGDGSKFVCN